jgi:predicted PurR-regulated permease PerM
MDRERIVQVFFFAFLGLIVYELYQILSPFLTPIGWAILLAFVAHPALLQVNRLTKSRSLAALIITIVVSLGVVIPALWLSGRVVAEAQTLYTAVSDLVRGGNLGEAGKWLRGSRVGAAASAILAKHGLKLEDEVQKFAIEGARLTRDYIIEHGTAVASNLATFVFHFGIALITFFYLLRDGEFYYEALRHLTPLHEQDKAVVFETLRATLSAVMRGLMLGALLDGVAIGAGYLACGIPYWAFLAILTAACGLLPIGGTALVWVPAALYLIYIGKWGVAIGFLVWSLVAIAVIDNFVKPMAMRHGTRLPTLAVFFGLLGGLEVYGPLGLFAGPAVIAVFAALLGVYRRTYVGDEAGNEDEPAQARRTDRKAR